MNQRSPAQNQSIAEIVERTSAETGLSIRWLDGQDTLERAAGDGLLALYQKIFAEPPYHEDFSQDEVRGIFADTLKAQGLIFTASLKDEFNKVSGFVSSLPLAAKKSVADHVRPILDIERTAYFAEDGIAAGLRRNGISGIMKRLLLEANRISGFDQVLLRTSIESYPQISAVTKAGGKVIADLFQQVASPKQGGLIAQDTRVFFLFKAGEQQDCDILSRVTIIRAGEEDIAIIRDRVPGGQQDDIARRIQKTYAGVRQVVFSDTVVPEKPIFDAKLYLPR